MRQITLTHCILCWVFISIYSAESYGAYTNYKSVLIGEQAAGLGGTYTAMVGDSSAAAFYNPATVVKIPGNSVSAAATIYNKFDTNYGNSNDIGKAGERINRGFFRTIPSAIGSIFRLGDWAFSLSIVVPDYDFFSGNIQDGLSSQSFLNYTDESLWSGISVSRKFNKNHSWGVTAYYTARSLIRTVTDRQIISTTQEILTYEEKSIKHNGIIFILGYLWELNEKWKLGLSQRLPALTISAEGSFYQSLTDTSNLPSDVSLFKNINAQTYIPPKTSLGLSYKANENLLFALDANYHPSFGYKDFNASVGADFIEHVSTWNLSFGFEYKFDDPKFAFRAGYFTNNPSTKIPLENPTQRSPDHLKLTGFSANIAFYTDKAVRYTIGGFYTGGNGYSVQKIGNEYIRMDKSHHIFSLLIGTSYEF